MKRPPPETWAALCLLVAGILVAVSAATGLVGLVLGPHWLSDQSLLERSLPMAAPGFVQPRVLAREPGTTATDRRLRFEVAIAVADGGRRLCQGLLIYHHRPAPATDLVWDDPLCAEAVAVVRLAHQILAGGSLRYSPMLYGDQRSHQAELLLRHWLSTGRLRLQDIPGADNRRLLSK